jgi:hypothetical protein
MTNRFDGGERVAIRNDIARIATDSRWFVPLGIRLKEA